MPLRTPVDIRPLGWSRVAFGALFLLRTTPLLAPLDVPFLRDASPLLGWPTGLFGAAPPAFTLPPTIVAAFCVLRTAGALAFTMGVETRLAGLVAGISGYVVLSQDPFAYINTLHLLFLGTLVLACTDAGSAVALRPSAVRSPGSSFGLLRVFVASVDFWSATAKVHSDWFNGQTLLQYARSTAFYHPLVDVLLSTPRTRHAIAVMVFMTELALGPLILWRRSRRVGVALAYAFHLALELTVRPDFLGWEMAALLITCWPTNPPAAQSASHAADEAGQPMRP